MPDAPLLTAEDLYHAKVPDQRTELVKGRMLVREPAGYRHGYVAARLTGRILAHVGADARRSAR